MPLLIEGSLTKFSEEKKNGDSVNRRISAPQSKAMIITGNLEELKSEVKSTNNLSRLGSTTNDDNIYYENGAED